MTTRFLLLRPVLALTLVTCSTASAYCNARYTYCIKVPSTLYPQGESDNGDGQVFLSRDARTELTVWGAMELPEASFTAQYSEAARGWAASQERPARVVTYTIYRPNFFVVSGVEGGRVFYQRTIYNKRAGTYATFLLRYPDGVNMSSLIKSLTPSFHF